jgi:hypothetical protein
MIIDSEFKRKIPPEEFVTFRRFTEETAAQELMALLKENDILYIWTKERESLDGLYGDKVFNHEYVVKINHTDFPAAENLLLAKSREELENVPHDHYLFSFSNEELMEVIGKRDEWNEFDYLLAQKILQERGVEINKTDLQTLAEQRIEHLAAPDKSHRHLIVFGYLSALAGGLLGIFIGWHLSTFKKLLPTGQRIYAFDVKDRTHGNRIVAIGFLSFIAVLLWRSGVFGND